MTNPTPRPALRKAADAEVHPAAPRPARSARASAAAAEPVPSPRPAAEPTSGGPKNTAKGSSKRAVDGEPAKAARTTGADDAASGATGAKAIGPTPRPRSTTTSATRSARSRGLRPVSPKSPATGKTPRRFSGSTSDHLRPEPEPEAAPTKGRRGPTNDGVTTKQAKPTKKQPDLMKGKSTPLDVTVPKALRKAAKSRAKAEGLDLDTVVIDLLHDWVTRRP